MAFEKFDLENLDKERRKAIAKSIRTISPEGIKEAHEGDSRRNPLSR
jgi:hypothetical protein